MRVSCKSLLKDILGDITVIDPPHPILYTSFGFPVQWVKTLLIVFNFAPTCEYRISSVYLLLHTYYKMLLMLFVLINDKHMVFVHVYLNPITLYWVKLELSNRIVVIVHFVEECDGSTSKDVTFNHVGFHKEPFKKLLKNIAFSSEKIILHK